jgi:adenosylhomocysteine nucleosidase
LSVVGIVAALAAEARALGPRVRLPNGLYALPGGTLLAVSGIGGPAATDAAARLVRAGAGSLVSWGLAGGLDPALTAGTVCLPDVVTARDGATFTTDAHWREIVAAALAGPIPVVNGSLLSLASAIDRPVDKAAAFGETGALAVDMESVFLAAVAAAHDLPFLTVRVVVDTASDRLPEAVVSATRDGRVGLLRLAHAVLRSPRQLAELAHLAGRYRHAVRSLAAVARSGALAPVAFGRAASRVA